MPTFTVFKGSEGGKIVQSQTTRPDLTDDQVLIKITASGLCGTDEHYKGADIVLGHEGAGVVEQTGPNVKSLKKGDRVGWGYEHNSCGTCEYCLTGREQYCSEREMYGEANLDQGSFATHAVWKEAWLYRIPDSMTDAEAAPLMCGGATVFNALSSYDIKSTDRVGVMGVGGLGHLAIQFAAKKGLRRHRLLWIRQQERGGTQARRKRIRRNEGKERVRYWPQGGRSSRHHQRAAGLETHAPCHGPYQHNLSAHRLLR